VNGRVDGRTTCWWWVRHAPVIGHGGAIYGNSEVDCDTSDEAAFRGLARRLPDHALWLTSHLGRTRRTAAAIAAAWDGATPAPIVEQDIGEQSFGDWHGRTHEELARSPDGVYHKFWTAPADHAPPGGESFVAVIGRVSAAVERITAEHGGRHIIAVAHGGSIRAALALALSLEPEAALAFRIENLSITCIEHVAGPGPGGDWRVVSVNHSPT
jgi:broad specificity phosphatase PhoE